MSDSPERRLALALLADPNHDGDSGGGTRLKGIDTAETDHGKPSVDIHPDGELATEALSRILHTVEDESDGTTYGRKVRTGYDEEGNDVGERLVRAGLAQPGNKTNTRIYEGTNAIQAFGFERPSDPELDDLTAQTKQETFNPNDTYAGPNYTATDKRGTYEKAWDRGMSELALVGAGLKTAIGEVFGDEEMQAEGRLDIASENLTQAASPRTIESYRDVVDSENPFSDGLTYALETLIESAPGLMVDAGLTIGTGGVGGAAAIARRAGVQGVKSYAKRAGALGAFMSGAGQGAGGMEAQLESAGFTDTLDATLTQGGVSGLMTVAPISAVLDKVLGNIGNEAIERTLTQRVKDVLGTGLFSATVEAPASAVESLSNQVLSAIYTGEELNVSQLIDDTIRGTVGGGAMGTGASTFGQSVDAMYQYAKGQEEKRVALGEERERIEQAGPQAGDRYHDYDEYVAERPDKVDTKVKRQRIGTDTFVRTLKMLSEPRANKNSVPRPRSLGSWLKMYKEGHLEENNARAVAATVFGVQPELLEQFPIADDDTRLGPDANILIDRIYAKAEKGSLSQTQREGFEQFDMTENRTMKDLREVTKLLFRGDEYTEATEGLQWKTRTPIAAYHKAATERWYELNPEAKAQKDKRDQQLRESKDARRERIKEVNDSGSGLVKGEAPSTTKQENREAETKRMNEQVNFIIAKANEDPETFAEQRTKMMQLDAYLKREDVDVESPQTRAEIAEVLNNLEQQIHDASESSPKSRKAPSRGQDWSEKATTPQEIVETQEQKEQQQVADDRSRLENEVTPKIEYILDGADELTKRAAQRLTEQHSAGKISDVSFAESISRLEKVEYVKRNGTADDARHVTELMHSIGKPRVGDGTERAAEKLRAELRAGKISEQAYNAAISRLEKKKGTTQDSEVFTLGDFDRALDSLHATTEKRAEAWIGHAVGDEGRSEYEQITNNDTDDSAYQDLTTFSDDESRPILDGAQLVHANEGESSGDFKLRSAQDLHNLDFAAEVLDPSAPVQVEAQPVTPRGANKAKPSDDADPITKKVASFLRTAAKRFAASRDVGELDGPESDTVVTAPNANSDLREAKTWRSQAAFLLKHTGVDYGIQGLTNTVEATRKKLENKQREVVETERLNKKYHDSETSPYPLRNPPQLLEQQSAERADVDLLKKEVEDLQAELRDQTKRLRQHKKWAKKDYYKFYNQMKEGVAPDSVDTSVAGAAMAAPARLSAEQQKKLVKELYDAIKKSEASGDGGMTREIHSILARYKLIQRSFEGKFLDTVNRLRAHEKSNSANYGHVLLTPKNGEPIPLSGGKITKHGLREDGTDTDVFLTPEQMVEAFGIGYGKLQVQAQENGGRMAPFSEVSHNTVIYVRPDGQVFTLGGALAAKAARRRLSDFGVTKKASKSGADYDVSRQRLLNARRRYQDHAGTTAEKRKVVMKRDNPDKAPYSTYDKTIGLGELSDRETDDTKMRHGQAYEHPKTPVGRRGAAGEPPHKTASKAQPDIESDDTESPKFVYGLASDVGESNTDGVLGQFYKPDAPRSLDETVSADSAYHDGAPVSADGASDTGRILDDAEFYLAAYYGDYVLLRNKLGKKAAQEITAIADTKSKDNGQKRVEAMVALDQKEKNNRNDGFLYDPEQLTEADIDALMALHDDSTDGFANTQSDTASEPRRYSPDGKDVARSRLELETQQENRPDTAINRIEKPHRPTTPRGRVDSIDKRGVLESEEEYKAALDAAGQERWDEGQVRDLESQALKALNNSPAARRRTVSAVRKFFEAKLTRINRISPKLANRLNRRPGEIGEGETFRQGQTTQQHYWFGQFQQAYGEGRKASRLLQRDYDRLLSGQPAPRLTAILDDFAKYVRKHDPMFSKPELPILLKAMEIQKNPHSFAAALKSHGVSDADANAMIESMMDRQGSPDGGADLTPRAQGGSKLITDNPKLMELLDSLGFVNKDAPSVMARYIGGVIQRAEWSRSFGREVKGEWDPSYHYNKELDRLDPLDPQRKELQELVGGILGRYHNDVSPALHTFNSASIGLMNSRLLLFSGIASLPELMLPYTRSRSVLAATTGLISFLRTVASKQGRAELFEFAHALGIMSDTVAKHSLMNLHNSDELTIGKLAHGMTDTMFRLNGQYKVVQLGRLMAAFMAREFVNTHSRKAKAGDETSIRYLKELNLEPSTFDKKDSDPKSAELYDKAVVQYVTESVLNPDQSELPLYASDPRFAVIAHLKSYMYAFWSTFHRGMIGNEIKNRAGDDAKAWDYAKAAMTYSPHLVLTATMMMGLGAASREIRDLAKWRGDKPEHLELSTGQELWDNIVRSGGLGPAQTLETALTSNRSFQERSTYVLGPVFDFFANTVFNGDFVKRPSELLPVINQMPKEAKVVNEAWRDLTGD